MERDFRRRPGISAEHDDGVRGVQRGGQGETDRQTDRQILGYGGGEVGGVRTYVLLAPPAAIVVDHSRIAFETRTVWWGRRAVGGGGGGGLGKRWGGRVLPHFVLFKL